MNGDRKILDKTVSHALSGEGAHVKTRTIFAGLDWQLAGSLPEGVSHSVFQLLKHMAYWQNWVVNWLDEKKPSIPKHAAGSWPKSSGPRNQTEWKEAIDDFNRGLDELDRQSQQIDLFTKHGQKSRLEMLQTIASHTSYHAGQVVFLRQMLGKWPPPSGGLTW